jgi:hypothetical protein
MFTLSKRLRRQWHWIVLLALWVSTTALGLGRILRYSVTPGRAAVAPVVWPRQCEPQIHLAPSGVTLVVVLHPQCPCSRATVQQLAELTTTNARGVSSYALFVRPHDFSEAWERSGLWQQVGSIPGAKAIDDVDGKLARSFGALTSGQTYAFDPSGRLLFSGGITSARGHMGDSAGADALHEILCGRAPQQDHTPVFGCALGTSDTPEGSIP